MTICEEARSYQFITNNHASFPLWWKESLLKHQKVSKYYKFDCLQVFLLFFMFSFTALIVKSSHIFAGICFINENRVQDHTWKDFNTKFGLQWKYRESSYQRRQILALFWKYVTPILRFYVTVQKLSNISNLEGSWSSQKQETVASDYQSQNIWDKP